MWTRGGYFWVPWLEQRLSITSRHPHSPRVTSLWSESVILGYMLVDDTKSMHPTAEVQT